jgi:hypothetical protein
VYFSETFVFKVVMQVYFGLYHCSATRTLLSKLQNVHRALCSQIFVSFPTVKFHESVFTDCRVVMDRLTAVMKLHIFNFSL